MKAITWICCLPPTPFGLQVQSSLVLKNSLHLLDLGAAAHSLWTDTACVGAKWTQGHADHRHVSLLKNEAWPETSLGVRDACCGTAHICASSPSGWQMEVAVGTLPASQGHPAAFTARRCLETALGSAHSATMGPRQVRVDICGSVLRNLLGLTRWTNIK